MKNIVEIKIRYNQKATEGEPVEYVSLYEVWQKVGYKIPHHRWVKKMLTRYKIKAQTKVLKSRTPGRNVIAYYIPLDKFTPIKEHIECRMHTEIVLKTETDEPAREFDIYEREELGKVGVVVLDGEMWFIASSILRLMKFEKTAISFVSPDREKNITGDLLGLPTNKQVKLISELGMYELIFHTTDAHARKVQDWLIIEVLPEVRKQIY